MEDQQSDGNQDSLETQIKSRTRNTEDSIVHYPILIFTLVYICDKKIMVEVAGKD